MSEDFPDFFKQKEVTARSEHLCCECKCEIKKGERYVLSSGLWDKFETFKQCSDCSDIAQSVAGLAMHEDEYPIFGDLASCVYDLIYPDFRGFGELNVFFANELGVDVRKILKLYKKRG